MAPKFMKGLIKSLSRLSSSGSQDGNGERTLSDKYPDVRTPKGVREAPDEEGSYTDYVLFLNALASHTEELQDSIDYDYPVFAYNIVQKIKPAIDAPDAFTLGEMRQVAQSVYEHCTKVYGAAKLVQQLMDMSIGVVIPGEWDKKGELLRALKKLARALSDEDVAPVMIKGVRSIETQILVYSVCNLLEEWRKAHWALKKLACCQVRLWPLS